MGVRSTAVPLSSSKATVLVVEDDPTLRTFYRSALAIGGFDVITADYGVEALYLIEGSTPRLVVLDLGLPRLSGRDVRRELASQIATRDLPIVVVTGETDDIDPIEFPCVLRKPVTAEALIEAVTNCLAQPN